jgi:hypothetical protein
MVHLTRHAAVHTPVAAQILLSDLLLARHVLLQEAQLMLQMRQLLLLRVYVLMRSSGSGSAAPLLVKIAR